MFLQCFSRTTSRIPSVGKRDRRKSREDSGHINNGKPAKLHEVHQLAGRVAALSRFVARLGEKALSFYALMKKSDKKFEWTEGADAAFSQLKKLLSTPRWLHQKKGNHYYYISPMHIRW
jgi:hypothetical protein